jgi:hypothetical protein
MAESRPIVATAIVPTRVGAERSLRLDNLTQSRLGATGSGDFVDNALAVPRQAPGSDRTE